MPSAMMPETNGLQRQSAPQPSDQDGGILGPKALLIARRAVGADDRRRLPVIAEHQLPRDVLRAVPLRRRPSTASARFEAHRMADSNVGGAALMGDHQSRKSTAATSHQAPQRGQPISNVPSSRSQSADWLHLPQWGHRWNGGTSPSSRAGQLLEAL